MATLTVQAPGVVTLVAAAGGGDSIPQGVRVGGWDLGVALVVRNADTTATTVTVAGEPGVSVPATTGTAVIPITGGSYGTLKAVTYSKVTSLTVGAIRVSAPVSTPV